MTQVDEKGHEGNTAVVVTAYLCWRKHGQRNSRTGGAPVDYYHTYFEHYYKIKRYSSCRYSVRQLIDVTVVRRVCVHGRNVRALTNKYIAIQLFLGRNVGIMRTTTH